MARNGAVGLDIGTRSVTVAHVEARRGEERVANFGGVDLPVDAVHEGEVLDPAEVAARVRELLDAAGIREKKVWLGVGNQRVVVRQIEMPWMDPAELRSSLRYQVQEHIPIPVEDAELDVHVLGEYTTEEDVRMLRVLLVAAHKDTVASHVAVASQAGLRPVGVDLNPFAVLRTLRTGDGVGRVEGEEVLVDVGAGVTNIVVHVDGVPRFVRILALGGDDITNALAAGLDLETGEAESFKRRIGLDEHSDDPAAGIVDDHARTFVDEIRSSLDYYQAQHGGRIARVVLTGGGSLLTGLDERLATVLRLPVERGNPFDLVPAASTAFGPAELHQIGPVLTTAVGLALGGLE